MLVPLYMNGQGLYQHPSIFMAPAPTADVYYSPGNTGQLLQPGHFDLGLDIGSSFTSLGGGASGMVSYLAPNFTYRLSDKFFLQGGVRISRYNFGRMNPSFGSESATFMPGTGQSYLMYASGSYLLTPKLTFSGTVFKNWDPSPVFRNNPDLDNNFQGMSLSMDYRITKSFRFGMEFRYQDQPSGIYSPWGLRHNSPFHTGW